ncbi:hypothetical protein EV182_000700, partial [Spiromyces aspiralis]
LTEVVRKRPYTVVLFDEIEKAHPKILNILLEVMDDACLTDGQGRVVDFSNTVIILTSNIGQDKILQYTTELPTTKPSLGEVTESGRLPDFVREQVLAELKISLRPELLNRLDDIIIFDRLSRTNLRHIVEHQVKLIEKRIKDKDISIELDHKAVDYVLTESYDPLYGARPIKRFLEKHLVTELSRQLIRNKLPEHSTVYLTHVDGSREDFEFEIVMKPNADQLSNAADVTKDLYNVRSTRPKRKGSNFEGDMDIEEDGIDDVDGI